MSDTYVLDAFSVALATQEGAALVTGDAELRCLEDLGGSGGGR